MKRWYHGKTLEQRRAWVARRDPEKIRAHDRRRHQTKNYKARQKLYSALKSGSVIRGSSCEKCGDANVQAHHDDYDKPLEVQWLCKTHHLEAHGELAGS